MSCDIQGSSGTLAQLMLVATQEENFPSLQGVVLPICPNESTEIEDAIPGGGSGITEYDQYSIVYSGVVQSIAASVCQGVQVSGENCSTRY